MKNQDTIKKELEKQYLYRLQLRIERKTKNCCRNCKLGIEQEFNLGEFGIQTRFRCKDTLETMFPCQKFDPIHTNKSIEQDLLNDIRDPAICGAKEPKIAALLWVLHDDKQSLLSKIKSYFKD